MSQHIPGRAPKIPEGPAVFDDFKKFLNEPNVRGHDVMTFLKEKAPRAHQVVLANNANVSNLNSIPPFKLKHVLNIAQIHWSVN